jgi:hypothetical protein
MDPDDRHVLAARDRGAVRCDRDEELEAFPGKALAEYGIHALHPDEFL